MGILSIPRYGGGGQYFVAAAVTRGDDFAGLQAALEATLTPRVDAEYVSSLPALVTERVSDDIVIDGATLDGLWPVGAAAPWIWVLAPREFNDFPQFRVDVWTDLAREDLADFAAARFDVEINGTAYDAGTFRTALARPAAGSALRLRLRFVDKVAVVTEIPPA